MDIFSFFRPPSVGTTALDGVLSAEAGYAQGEIDSARVRIDTATRVIESSSLVLVDQGLRLNAIEEAIGLLVEAGVIGESVTS